jgi:hypothetical protein
MQNTSGSQQRHKTIKCDIEQIAINKLYQKQRFSGSTNFQTLNPLGANRHKNKKRPGQSGRL